MMLDKINTDKPVLEPQLTELLPYLDKTILINETFYPQLVAELKKLNVKIIPINDSPQTPDELFTLILDLGKQLGNEQKAADLVTKLKSQNFPLKSTAYWYTDFVGNGRSRELLSAISRAVKFTRINTVKNTTYRTKFLVRKVILSQPECAHFTDWQTRLQCTSRITAPPYVARFFKTNRL